MSVFVVLLLCWGVVIAIDTVLFFPQIMQAVRHTAHHDIAKPHAGKHHPLLPRHA